MEADGVEVNIDLEVLEVRVIQHEAEHESMQMEYKRTLEQYNLKCNESLKIAMGCLFNVIEHVRQADKKLIKWHDRSKTLKKVLRVVGIDRRTHIVIDRGTRDLQERVQIVESKFTESGCVFDNGLKATQRIESEVLEFSVYDVGGTWEDIFKTRTEYDRQFECLYAKFSQCRSLHEESLTKIKDLESQYMKKQTDCEKANTSAAGWGLAGIGILTLASVPFGMIGVPVMAGIGGLAFMKSAQNGRQGQRLKEEEDHLKSMIQKEDTILQQAKTKLDQSARNHLVCKISVGCLEQLQSKSTRFLEESQETMDKLRGVQIILGKVRDKLELMASELSECRYLETRQGISSRLHDVVGLIQKLPGDLASSNTKDFGLVTDGLAEIDKLTNAVLRIVQVSTESA